MSDDQWSYQLCGAEFGPVSFEMLAELAQTGNLGANDLVRGPKGNWIPASEIVGLVPDSSSEDLWTELPSIAAETAISRVVSPKDRASLETLGPAREEAIGPQPLAIPKTKSNSRPAAAKPQSMTDALSSMLEDAESAEGHSPAQGHISPQRANASRPAASDQQATRASNSKSVTAQERPSKPAVAHRVASEPETRSVSAGKSEVPIPTADATATSPAVPSTPPPSTVPQPIHSRTQQPRQQSIQQSRGFDFDPEIVKKALAGVAACATLAAIVVFGKPLLAGSHDAPNIVESQWHQTDQLTKSLLAIVGSGDPSALPQFASFAATKTREIVERLDEADKAGTNIDPVLSDAIRKIHREAIPPLMTSEGWTPENIESLTLVYESAKVAAEG